MLALAFGNHDLVTEFLNEEIERAGQVALEPWPTIKWMAHRWTRFAMRLLVRTLP